MTSRRSTTSRFGERAILVIAALGIVLYGFPGLMSYDSVDQLDQARRWALGDWHPPAMAALWRVVELVIAGPFGMLLLQVAAVVVGAYGTLRREVGARTSAIAALVICWFPPVLTTMGVIWKDSQMAGYLLLAIAALGSSRRWHRVAAIVLVIVAGAMRHNAPAATLVPLVILWAPALPRIKRLAVGLAVWIAVTAASLGLDAALDPTPQHAFETSIAVTDIVGTLHWTAPRTDAELRELLAGTPLRVDHDIQAALVAHDDPRGWAYYYRSDPPIAEPATDDERAAIRRAWQGLVLHEPLAYLHHRWQIFRRVLDIGHAGTPPITTSFSTIGDANARLHHDATPSLLQRALFAWVRVIGVWYAPVIYVAVAIILLVGFARTPTTRLLLGSGLLYELSFFPFAPSADVRYSHWLTLTTILALVLVIARRATTAATSSRDPAAASARSTAPG